MYYVLLIVLIGTTPSNTPKTSSMTTIQYFESLENCKKNEEYIYHSLQNKHERINIKTSCIKVDKT